MIERTLGSEIVVEFVEMGLAHEGNKVESLEECDGPVWIALVRGKFAIRVIRAVLSCWSPSGNIW